LFVKRYTGERERERERERESYNNMKNKKLGHRQTCTKTQLANHRNRKECKIDIILSEKPQVV
jgi:hypothetical protein